MVFDSQAALLSEFSSDFPLAEASWFRIWTTCVNTIDKILDNLKEATGVSKEMSYLQYSGPKLLCAVRHASAPLRALDEGVSPNMRRIRCLHLQEVAKTLQGVFEGDNAKLETYLWKTA